MHESSKHEHDLRFASQQRSKICVTKANIRGTPTTKWNALMIQLDEKLEPIFDEVVRRNAGEQEFHQAVRKVLESLGRVIAKRPEYADDALIERICEPSQHLGNTSEPSSSVSSVRTIRHAPTFRGNLIALTARCNAHGQSLRHRSRPIAWHAPQTHPTDRRQAASAPPAQTPSAAK